MKHIVTFSGGKDSQATCIWVNNNLDVEWSIAFCDTAWENPITYKFMLDFESKISKDKVILKSKKYNGFIDLVTKKKRFPSTKARFCTEELKIKPMIDYILDVVKSDCKIYQGIRWQESKNRSKMSKTDCFFKNYYEPIIRVNKKTGKEKKSYYTYRKKEVLAFLENYESIIIRPIISWSAVDVMKYILKNGFDYNPLYDMGFHRVGCFPCIMCNHSEVKLIIENFPDRIKEIRAYENLTNSTFFPPNYIPIRYCTKIVKIKDSKTGVITEKKVPTIDDVVKYIKDRRMKQTKMFESSCKNFYISCE